MPYNADLTRIKQILEITDSASDTELNADLAAAYVDVNNYLKKKGFTVPLASSTDAAKEAEAYWAAAKFRDRRHTATSKDEAERYRAEGLRGLNEFVEAEKNQPYLGRV